eukprot:scaffold6758_cov116-Isochrysis_galbana.AAC.4
MISATSLINNNRGREREPVLGACGPWTPPSATQRRGCDPDADGHEGKVIPAHGLGSVGLAKHVFVTSKSFVTKPGGQLGGAQLSAETVRLLSRARGRQC